MKNISTKSILVEFAKAKKGASYNDKYTLATTENVGGFTAKIVDELPETGEPSIIYLILKETTAQGDIYDEWMWVIDQNDEYTWEHIGATNEVTLEIDDAMSDSSENAVQNKVIKDYVDNSVSGKQDALTTGDGIDITNGVIKATNTGKARVLTSADYNYDPQGTGTNTAIGLWILPDGLYCGDNLWFYYGRNSGTLATHGVYLVARTNNNVVRVYNLQNGSYYFVVNGTANNAIDILESGDVKDELTSYSTTQALSANQGRVLNDNIGDLTTLTTTAKTSTVAAINELKSDMGNIETALHIINYGQES